MNVYEYNIIADDLGGVQDVSQANFILHMAYFVSPPFYRRCPIETLEANVFGLKRLRDFLKARPVRGFVFFSRREVYGYPFPEFISTDENYGGNVAAIGPSACYDEAKQFGEPTCYMYSLQYGLPIVVVLPLNNFEPGLYLEGGRLPADFARAVVANKGLVLFSDGSPTRTFCYFADAALRYLNA